MWGSHSLCTSLQCPYHFSFPAGFLWVLLISYFVANQPLDTQGCAARSSSLGSGYMWFLSPKDFCHTGASPVPAPYVCSTLWVVPIAACRGYLATNVDDIGHYAKGNGLVKMKSWWRVIDWVLTRQKGIKVRMFFKKSERVNWNFYICYSIFFLFIVHNFSRKSLGIDLPGGRGRE